LRVSHERDYHCSASDRLKYNLPVEVHRHNTSRKSFELPEMKLVLRRQSTASSAMPRIGISKLPGYARIFCSKSQRRDWQSRLAWWRPYFVAP
jgi:hypothetical protein